jgi:hypothetical protein
MKSKMKLGLLLYLGLITKAMSLELNVEDYLGTSGSGVNAMSKYRVSVQVSGADVMPKDEYMTCLGSGGIPGSKCSLQIVGYSCNVGIGSFVRLGPWESTAGTKPKDYLDKNAGRYTAEITTCGDKAYSTYGRADLVMRLFSNSPYLSGFTLASTHGGGGIVIPPITPPVVPLSCKIDAVKGEFDFGKKSEIELPGVESDLWVDMRCEGTDGNTATGKIIVESDSGGNRVDMKNGEGDIIPAMLIADKSTNSNILRFTANNGHYASYQLWAKVLPFSISSYGNFMGNAIIRVSMD